VHDGENLIVSHIALDTEHPQKVLEQIIAMKIPFRQNVSVPDPLKARNNFVEDFGSDDGKVMQFFIRDPDGYYLELCNCDILTKFCLMKEHEISKTMQEATGNTDSVKTCLKLHTVCKISVAMRRWKLHVRANLGSSFEEILEREMLRLGTQRAASVNKDILHTLQKRRKTYCDITQSYSEEQLVEALLKTGNDVRLALLALKADRGRQRVCIPPSYLAPTSDDSPKAVSESIQPHSFFMPVVRCGPEGSGDLVKSKGFFDRDATMDDARS